MAAGAHQDAVEVVPSHVSGGRRQQRPRLALVVREETLHLTVDQFVGQIHAIDALHLRSEEKKKHATKTAVSFFC